MIVVPLSAPLDQLAALANSSLPGTLHAPPDAGQRCVEPERACTKVPEFRGLKVTMKNRCVDITPAIDCTISQRVWRDGPLRVEGAGDTITLRQNVRAQATVRGRGDIGRHIRETVNGAADFTISAQPGIANDWQVTLPAPAITFRWTERPNVRLFNVIPITFGSEAQAELERAIDEFRNTQLPAELAKIDLRAEIAPIWSQMQQPVELPTGDDTALWLHLRPEAVGIAPLAFDAGRVATRVAISVDTRVTDGPDSPFDGPAPALPPLTAVPDGGVAIVVPVRLGPDTLDRALAATLPFALTSDGALAASVTIDAASFAFADDRLEIRTSAKVDVSGFDFEGPLTISGQPRWDPVAQTILLDDLAASVDAPGLIATAVNAIIATDRARTWLSGQFRVSLLQEARDIQKALETALNRDIAPDLKVASDMRASIAGVEVRDGALQVTLRANGTVEVIGAALQ